MEIYKFTHSYRAHLLQVIRLNVCITKIFAHTIYASSADIETHISCRYIKNHYDKLNPFAHKHAHSTQQIQFGSNANQMNAFQFIYTKKPFRI